MNEISKPPASGAASAADAALLERYREPPAAGAKPWNDVLALLLSHRTSRAYTPEPVTADMLEMLVAAAQSAPTSSNMQAWSVVAVEDPARKAALARVTGGQAHVTQAPLVLVFLADLARIDAVAAARGTKLETLDYTESFLISSLDAALAAQNVVVAAESMGLGTCYLGSLRNDVTEVARVLELPPRCYGVFGLTVGHPDPAVLTGVKPRLAQEAVLHRETYSAAGQAEAAARYDAHMLAFKREQGQDNQPWTDQTIQRLAKVAAMRGRDVLRQGLARLGFQLH